MSGDFSIIIVSYRTGPVLDDALSAALSSSARDVILVDNGNSEEVLARLRAWAEALAARRQAEPGGPSLEIVSGHGNIGFGRGCNLGARRAAGAALVFVNPDAVLAPGAAEALARAALDHTVQPALVGGLLVDEAGREQRGARRGELSLAAAIISGLGLGRPGVAAGIWRDFNREREPMPDETVDIPTVSGALFAMRADAFGGLGGFDERYFLHLEDVDLCDRVRQSGGVVRFDPSARAIHAGQTSNAPAWRVQWHKLVGFGRFFLQRVRSPLGAACVILCMPIIAGGLLLRSATLVKRAK